MTMIDRLGPVLQNQQNAGGAAFNPETDITWHSFFWAEGTDFVAKGYSDTDAVDDWPNETGEADATQATGTKQPTFVASATNLNSQPAVDFDGGDALQSLDFTADPTYPLSIIVVLDLEVRGGMATGGNANANEMRVGTSGTKYAIRHGVLQTSTAVATTGAQLFRAYFVATASNDTLHVDETLVIDANAGIETADGITIGATDTGAALYYNGLIAMVGTYEGDISSDGSWADFKTWVTSHYGITL